MAVRSLEVLEPETRRRARAFLQAAKDGGLTLLVTCTLRTAAEQAALYASGRTRPGAILTHAKPGQSMHEWGRALDVVPMMAGACVWGTTGKDLQLWQAVGRYGEWAGLEWAGRWDNFREYPHFQFKG